MECSSALPGRLANVGVVNFDPVDKHEWSGRMSIRIGDDERLESFRIIKHIGNIFLIRTTSWDYFLSLRLGLRGRWRSFITVLIDSLLFLCDRLSKSGDRTDPIAIHKKTASVFTNGTNERRKDFCTLMQSTTLQLSEGLQPYTIFLFVRT